MNFQNIFRGIVTTLFGVAMMSFSLYDYLFADEGVLELYYAIGMFVVGTVFLLMPDQIPVFVQRVVDKFVFKKEEKAKD